MPRQSRGRSTSSRPAPAAPFGARGAHTAAAPPAHSNYASPPTQATHAPSMTASQATTKQPGMIAQMAATAGSVAAGSVVGHGISNMLFGGSRSAEPMPDTMAQQAQVAPAQDRAAFSCDVQAKDFTKCLETADVQNCTWYLEQLKACQAAAATFH